MLSSYRVLDLTGENGFLCGKMLGDLGADVIKIEDPGGDPGRSIGPFFHDIPAPDKSLYWFAFNASKRGITLNLNISTGKDIFKRLVATTDIVLESFTPGYLDSLGLGYSELSKINPGVILTSITPFGQTGPYKNHVASDINIQALSGLLYASGDPDRPPVQVGYPQASLFGGAEAAIATLMALSYRRATGEGQHIDISAQRSMFHTMFDIILWWAGHKVIVRRQGSIKTRGKIYSQQIWECKDGYIHFYYFAGPWAVKAGQAMVKLMNSEGYATEFLKKIDWNKFDWSKLSQDEVNQIEEPTRRFFQAHTKDELYKKALVEHIMLYPVNTVEDILKNEQLMSRQFWVDLEHDELDAKITYPGPWFQSTEAPMKMQRRAPAVGEHNLEIYGKELGLSNGEMSALKANGII